MKKEEQREPGWVIAIRSVQALVVLYFYLEYIWPLISAFFDAFKGSGY